MVLTTSKLIYILFLNGDFIDFPLRDKFTRTFSDHSAESKNMPDGKPDILLPLLFFVGLLRVGRRTDCANGVNGVEGKWNLKNGLKDEIILSDLW